MLLVPRHGIDHSKNNSISHVPRVCVKCCKMDPGLVLPAWQDLRSHLAAAQFGCVNQYSAR